MWLTPGRASSCKKNSVPKLFIKLSNISTYFVQYLITTTCLVLFVLATMSQDSTSTVYAKHSDLSDIDIKHIPLILCKAMN